MSHCLRVFTMLQQQEACLSSKESYLQGFSAHVCDLLLPQWARHCGEVQEFD